MATSRLLLVKGRLVSRQIARPLKKNRLRMFDPSRPPKFLRMPVAFTFRPARIKIETRKTVWLFLVLECRTPSPDLAPSPSRTLQPNLVATLLDPSAGPPRLPTPFPRLMFSLRLIKC